jgi:RND superfamily putative drug exporter
MERLARTVLRARWVVIVVWLGALVAGGFAASAVPDRLSFDFSLPGQEGYETSVKLQQAYGTTYFPAAVPVLTAPEGQTIEQHRDDVTAVTNELRKIPGVRVIDYGTTGDSTFLTDDGRSTFAFVYGPQPRGRAAQPDQPRRRVRRRHLVLAGGPRLRGDLRDQ